MPPGATDWRLQRFGRLNVKKIEDPLIEPLWIGLPVIVRIGDGQPPTIIDEWGEPVEDAPEIAAALTAANRASVLVLDGVLTRTPGSPPVPEPVGPTMAEVGTQFFIGSMVRRRRPAPASARAAEVASGPLAFVATDVLAVDGESLLDVPLLERKRILEGVLDEGELVRRTVFVRPPLALWLGTWRSLGFLQVAYKAANSRYLPGEANPAWATAAIPPR